MELLSKRNMLVNEEQDIQDFLDDLIIIPLSVNYGSIAPSVRDKVPRNHKLIRVFGMRSTTKNFERIFSLSILEYFSA
jgi:hypothetical protein